MNHQAGRVEGERASSMGGTGVASALGGFADRWTLHGAAFPCRATAPLGLPDNWDGPGMTSTCMQQETGLDLIWTQQGLVGVAV